MSFPLSLPRLSVALLSFGLLFVLAGCSPTPTNNTDNDDAEEAGCPSCCAKNKLTANGGECCGDAPTSDDKEAKSASVELKSVKFDGLLKAIESHKGKVVVLDIWASFCSPCRKEFPHLVALHRKYGADGLVCMSVSVDEPEAEKAALSFLQKQKATFENYRLNEEVDFWQDKWDIKGIPVVLIYDRAGKQVAKLTNDDPDNQFTYEKDVEPLVRKLLKSK